MNWQIPCQLGGLPIQIVFLSNGQAAFVPMGNFATIVEDSPKGLVIVSPQGMLVYSVEIRYNAATDLTEDLKGWVKSFGLVSPV